MFPGFSGEQALNPDQLFSQNMDPDILGVGMNRNPVLRFQKIGICPGCHP
jgi:hypothetical protein